MLLLLELKKFVSSRFRFLLYSNSQLFNFFFLFIHKHIYNRNINKKIRKAKTKIHITVIRCNASGTPEIKLKGEQSQN